MFWTDLNFLQSILWAQRNIAIRSKVAVPLSSKKGSELNWKRNNVIIILHLGTERAKAAPSAIQQLLLTYALRPDLIHFLLLSGGAAEEERKDWQR